MKQGGVFKVERFAQFPATKVYHHRFQRDGERIIVATFFQFLSSDSQNVRDDIFVDDARAAYCRDHLDEITYSEMFKAEQLGLSTGYWRLSDRVVYQTNPQFISGAEIEGLSLWVVWVDPNGRLRGPMNKYISSKETKANMGREADLGKQSWLMTVFRPHENATIDECVVTYGYSAEEGFFCNQDAEEIVAEQARWTLYRPDITVTGPTTMSPDSVVTLTMKLTDPEDGSDLIDISRRVYIEHTAGQINKQRLDYDGSPVTLKVRSTDLEPGDEIKVKFNWRHFTGVFEHIITVV